MSAYIPSDVVSSDRAYPTSAENLESDRKKSSEKNPVHRKRVFQFLLHEPMVHFITAGALIFAVAHFISEYRDRSARTIVVEAPLQDRLTKLYTVQLGAAPTAAQFSQLVDSYVHDEVLYREALALGLDKGDEIVRRRLVQKMGFLQSDLIIAADPDEPTLRNYYEQHRAQFSEPVKIAFQQRFWGGDAAGVEVAYRRASQALTQLNAAGASSDNPGDRSPLGAHYQQLGRIELSRLFGETPIVDELLKGAQGTWLGPFESGYGWHLVKIEQRDDPRVPVFETVREAVATAVSAQQKEDNNRRSFEQLRSRYDVQISTRAVAP